MIRISNAAQKYFAKLLANQEKDTKIRIFVINPGTLNAEVGISYCSLDNIEITDVVLKFEKLTVYVDELSMPYLKDMEIDLKTNLISSQLILNAPNANKISKMSTDSPLEERIEYFLQLHINPKLAEHGGRVSLIEITEKRYVILRFSGGCNGCSMANLTLKRVIEDQLLKEFPELKGVQDITNHQRSKHSYY